MMKSVPVCFAEIKDSPPEPDCKGKGRRVYEKRIGFSVLPVQHLTLPGRKVGLNGRQWYFPAPNTEIETLKSWSPLLAVLGITGAIVSFVLALIFPLR